MKHVKHAQKNQNKIFHGSEYPGSLTHIFHIYRDLPITDNTIISQTSLFY